ncbi:16S rRNA (adenine(1518)-N(6)/adenine(1519)-N(6))-dimethyltransferase RsmA [Enterobacteriaceae endosymbiont of Macroplea appendiculata]|uniref:16S rRNA (adenine(1518)-N(6)/adenine(1519)-N(6))- dimethyltransferase RsmA n=1 Tax=Enterobacteriaceae endosymbiont of Macroplea appendiculata TaxID=2675790 RepID=UPI00144940EA|nr:16S rRNA (adenine(1518)-N(6)/adenine(1519)-N(6))-dimethyltransferase RsmA [Enterobacteriaceae endosymbiont of Macroplea appendiculata]QJC30786.1 16S rRNA (adenine(1518)-N(6)/adenine(1519)-N(6))-dimethyltransferase RsmA [Enterobacteriaceae endosymbiont of Macroplea appendiculata]
MKILFKKKYGQHILKNTNIIRKIITTINPKHSNYFIEIGPGLGALTIPMTYYNTNITLIEIDYRFVTFLKKHHILKNLSINIIHNNVFNIDYAILSKKKHKKIRIFGSLPYNISTQLLFFLLQYKKYIKDMNFIMQKEVIQCLTAKPGEKNYGCLSIMVQLHYQIQSLFEIQTNAFYPIPKVMSGMIHLKPYLTKYYDCNNIIMFQKIIKQAFSMRRKILRNSLKNLFTIEDLNQLGIDYKMRAENVSIKEYCQLSAVLESNYKKGRV